MLKATLLTVIFSLTAASKARAIFALAGVVVLTGAEGAYIALHHHHTIMHGLRAFGVLAVFGQVAYLLATILVF